MDDFEWCGTRKGTFLETRVVYATVFVKSAQRLLNFLCNLCWSEESFFNIIVSVNMIEDR